MIFTVAKNILCKKNDEKSPENKSQLHSVDLWNI